MKTIIFVFKCHFQPKSNNLYYYDTHNFILRALKISCLSTSPLIDTVKGRIAGFLSVGLTQRASDLPNGWASTERAPNWHVTESCWGKGSVLAMSTPLPPRMFASRPPVTLMFIPNHNYKCKLKCEASVDKVSMEWIGRTLWDS